LKHTQKQGFKQDYLKEYWKYDSHPHASTQTRMAHFVTFKTAFLLSFIY